MFVILQKIKEKGLRWLVARVRRELRVPSNKSLRNIIDFLLGAKLRILNIITKAKLEDDDVLYCIYDLEICDLTFVAAIHLIDFEMQARKRNKKGFIFVVVPSSLDPSLEWEEYNKAIDQNSKLWRFQNLVLPLTFLSPYCQGTYVLPRRADAITLATTHDVYPDRYDGINLRTVDLSELLLSKWDKPGLFEGLKANTQGLKYVKDWLHAKGLHSSVVTITLRDSPFDTVRNSNNEAWSEFTHYLLANGYDPVIIPDTDNAFSEKLSFGDVPFFNECAWNMGLRMALYESAYLNFFVSNGCIVLALFNPDCSYIALDQLPKGINNSEDEYKKMYESYGRTLGDHQFSNQRQRLCFKPDTYENIRTEFDRFVKDNPPVKSFVDTK